ncbi:hypothetical protein [Bacillus subtilis]|uniref:SU10 major capsid protein n=1 Tax=Bacillus subtilis TaxID=1423 RepID=UPI0025C95984|nr:hypothetical protein [Bacillus subtilis]GLI90598.1 hypothetical protein ANABIO4_39500 [Bacillus subtilis]
MNELNFDMQGAGFGIGSQESVANLNKALEAGYGTSPETQSGGGAFRVESLESSLKVLTYTDQQIKFWKRIPKLTATNTVEEYNQLLSYGADGGGFLPEGQTPDTEDSQYQRQAAFVKFLGITREVTHQMTLVNSAHGDVIARSNQDGIMSMLKKLEHGLFWGNSKLGAGGTEYVEFDGLDSQISEENTINLKGNPLEPEHLNFGSNMIIDNFGTPTDLFVPYAVQAHFANSYIPKERQFMPTAQSNTAGTVIDTYNTIGGPVNFTPDVFLRQTKPLSALQPHAKAPAQPASVTAEDLAAATTDGEFYNSGAGVYKYFVTAANRHGESAATEIDAPVTLTADDLQKAVTIKIKNASSSMFPVDYYTVYRTEAGGSKAYQIARIPASSAAGGSETLFKDRNLTMPNTYTAFMGEMAENTIAFKQLAPLTKMDLATVGPSYRWMILLYGTPILYAPKKWVRFKNIKAEIGQFA